MPIDAGGQWLASSGTVYKGIDLDESDATDDIFICEFTDGTGNCVGTGGGLDTADRTLTATGTTGAISDGFRVLDGVGYTMTETLWNFQMKGRRYTDPWHISIHGRNWNTGDAGTTSRGIYNWLNANPNANTHGIYVQSAAANNIIRIIVVYNNVYREWGVGASDAGYIDVGDLSSTEFWMCLWQDPTQISDVSTNVNTFFGLKKGSTAPEKYSDFDYNIVSGDETGGLNDWGSKGDAQMGDVSPGYGIGSNNGSMSDADFEIKTFIASQEVLIDPSGS